VPLELADVFEVERYKTRQPVNDKPLFFQVLKAGGRRTSRQKAEKSI